MGDLDVTTIDELPKGRTACKDYTFRGSRQKRSLFFNKRAGFIRTSGVYCIPLIDESEAISAKNATQEAIRLQNEVSRAFK